MNRWFRVAIGLPLAAILGLTAAGVVDPVYGVVLLTAFAPAGYFLWRRLVRDVRADNGRAITSPADENLLTPYAQTIIDVIPDAVVLVDADYKVAGANATARDLFGVRLIGRDFTQILRHPDAVEAMEQAMETASARSQEVTVLSPGERQFILTALPMAAVTPTSDEAPAEPRHAMTIALHEVTALKRSEQLRADFVANASHELRTPLASLIGFIETLQGPGKDDPDARARFLKIMEQEAARMARLIDDLLSLSRIELDEHVSPSADVNIVGVIKSSVEALTPLADERSMRVEVSITSESAVVVGDPDQLRQVFQNLIDNAIKYGREGTAVQITGETVARLAETGGAGLSISVFNEGEGIEREHLPRLTDRFYRVDPARSRTLGGTGLGLAIVKHIVNRHRGQLAFDSTPRVGTTVTVSLPVSGKHKAAETA